MESLKRGLLFFHCGRVYCLDRIEEEKKKKNQAEQHVVYGEIIGNDKGEIFN